MTKCFGKYDDFIKTTKEQAASEAFSGFPVFTPPTDRLVVGQHLPDYVGIDHAMYQDVEKTRKWLNRIKYSEADRWLEYIKHMHESVKENGAYLNIPAFVHTDNRFPGKLVVIDGAHRAGACVANSVRVPCVITGNGARRTDDFVRYVDYRTKMDVSTGYDSWRSLENRYEIMRSLDWDGKVVLDLGCNIGSVCREAQRLGAKRVYGIDYDPECISMAATSGMCFICHDLEQGFSLDDKIDVIIMNSIVFWVKSDQFYSSIKRALSANKNSKILFEAHHKNIDDPLYDKIKEICSSRSLLGYTDYKRGSSNKRAVYELLQ